MTPRDPLDAAQRGYDRQRDRDRCHLSLVPDPPPEPTVAEGFANVLLWLSLVGAAAGGLAWLWL